MEINEKEIFNTLEVVKFDFILGKTLVSIEGAKIDSYEIVFKDTDGVEYKMMHEQDCCENVAVNDITGDIETLIGNPILRAESVSYEPGEDEGYESATWTFYKFSTIKGDVTLRWLGESNGYYGEEVDFFKCTN